MKIKSLLIGALAGAMTLGMAMGAMATDPDPTTPATTDEALAAVTKKGNEAKIVKYLELGEGVTAPSVDYVFHFDYIGDTANANAPDDFDAIINSMVKIDADDTANDDMKGSKTIESIFEGKTLKPFTLYVYNVTETAPVDTGTQTVHTFGEDEKMVVSTDNYTLRFNTDKDGKINDVTVEKPASATTDKPNEGTTANKVDPTIEPVPAEDPEDGTTPGEEQNDGQNKHKGEGFQFVNIYSKMNDDNPVTPTNPGTDPSDPTKGALRLTKTVACDDETMIDKTKAFPFTVAITIPAAYYHADAEHAADKFTAYKYVPDGTEGNFKAGVAVDFTVTYATTGVGTATANVELKDGEKLIFNELPAGTEWTMTENLATVDKDSYTPSYKVDNTDGAATGTKSTNLATTEGATKPVKDSTSTAVDYTNTFDKDSITPTGIVINNLPYIILVAIAAFGFLFLAARKRRAQY